MGTVFRLYSGGSPITRFSLGAGYNLTGVSFEPYSGSMIGYIVGYIREGDNKWKGVIWKTTNGGGSANDWTPIPDYNLPQFHVPTPFLNVATGSGGVVWVSCGNGYVIKSLNYGANWLRVTKPGGVGEKYYGWLWGISLDRSDPNNNNAWVCSDQSRIIAHTTDGGQSWDNYEEFPTDSLAYNDIDCYGNGQVLAAASKGRLVYCNNGTQWTRYYPFGSEDTAQWFYGACIYASTRWGVGSGGMIGSSTGKHWYSEQYDFRDINGDITLGEYQRFLAVGTNAAIYCIEGAEEFGFQSQIGETEWTIDATDVSNDHGWRVLITWNQYQNSNNYKIYCRPAPNTNLGGTSGFGEFQLIGEVNNTGFFYDKALTGQNIQYKVEAYYNSQMLTYAVDECVSIDNVRPPQVTDLQGQYIPELDAVKLTWDPVPQTGDPQYPETYEPNLGGYWVCPVIEPADEQINHLAPLYRNYYIESIPAGHARPFQWGFKVQAMDRSFNRSLWQQDYYFVNVPGNRFVNSPYATAFTQGKHLVRVPNTQELHMAYETNGEIIYSYSIDNGEHWYTDKLGAGLYPCIGINYKCQPWIAYVKGRSLICQIRREDGTYKDIIIYDGDENHWAGPPSMQLATMPIKEDVIDYAYITYPIYEGSMPDNPGPQPPASDHSWIYVSLFDTTGIDIVTHLIDEGTVEEPVSHPCVGVTPADFIHIAWQKVDEIWYTTNTEKVTPENWQDVQWTPGYNLSNTEEVSEHPFVESYGDLVYVVWKEGNPGEIKRKLRYAWEPSEYENWDGPKNLSNSPEYDSDFPQMSTGDVTLWQEVDNDTYKVYANILGNVSCLTPEADDVSYIHTNVLVTDAQAPAYIVYYCYTDEITEGELYEVKFDKYEYVSESGGDEEFVYYEGKVGNEVQSPYCQLRTGYFNYGDYKIDYGNRLEYRLKYLDPCKYYLFEPIIYHRAQALIRQQLQFEDTIANITINPLRVETLHIHISPNSYQEDLQAALNITRTQGAFALLGDFKLYGYEIIRNSGGDGPQSGGLVKLPTTPALLAPRPNPFTNYTEIKFQIPSKTNVDLKIYNTGGRLIKTLVSNGLNPGYYTITWHGNDEQGRVQSKGIYFIRLKTKDYDATKKMVLVR
jgi:hypothetical protein